MAIKNKFREPIKKKTQYKPGLEKFKKCSTIKNNLDIICNRIPESIQIRRRCNWYEHGENLTMYFLNLEIQHGS